MFATDTSTTTKKMKWDEESRIRNTKYENTKTRNTKLLDQCLPLTRVLPLKDEGGRGIENKNAKYENMKKKKYKI